MPEEEINRYNETELIAGSIIMLGIDGVCFIIDWTGVGLAIAPIIQAGGTGALTMWAWRKGDTQALKMGRQVAKYASNALPLLPTLTLMFLIEAYMHNHPEKFAAAEKLAGATTKPKPTIAK
ncbi:hypothetical protein HY967_03030 [Candidatus Jorgensenbacteria bacterium]|nr:hypothetical protein [Candidatus Jorgensenbacteria bacterium]